MMAVVWLGLFNLPMRFIIIHYNSVLFTKDEYKFFLNSQSVHMHILFKLILIGHCIIITFYIAGQNPFSYS
jgi:hypothetical protein